MFVLPFQSNQWPINGNHLLGGCFCLVAWSSNGRNPPVAKTLRPVAKKTPVLRPAPTRHFSVRGLKGRRSLPMYSYVLLCTPMYSRLQSVTQRASPRTIQSEKCRVGAGGRKWRVWELCRSAHRTSRGAVLRASTSRQRVEEYL